MKKISDCLKENFEIEYRVHSLQRMFGREITESDVKYLLVHGDIVELYEDDYPLPSMLINGCSSSNIPLHIVIAVNSDEKKLVVVTVYIPTSERWNADFTRRIL